MNDVKLSAGQLESVRYLRGRLDNSTDPHGVRVNKGDLRDALDLVDVLMDPQPALPTEPGVYSVPARSQAHLGHWHTDGIELHYLNAEGNWCDVGWGNALVSEKRAFTRLVPERPQVTRDQVSRAIADVAQQFGLPVHTANYVSALTKALVNGSPA